MRIISGRFKGRTLKVPNTKFTRPTTDRVRETLFNLLNNKIDFKGIKVLDIYSGSGALGLESASRGAEEIHFVEKNFPVQKILEENISQIKDELNYKIFKMEAVKFSAVIKEKYDLILADPPFFKDDIFIVVKNIFKNALLAENGLMVIERSIQTKENDVKNFGIEPFKKIGDTLLYEFTNEIFKNIESEIKK